MAQNDIFGNDMVIGSGSRGEPGAKKLLRANRQRVHKAAMDGSVGNLFGMNCEILENRLTCESKADTKYDTSKVINFDVDCKHIDQGIRCAAKQYVEENSLDGVTGLGLECDFKSRSHQKCKGHFATEQPSSKTLNASQKPALEINCKWTEGLNSIKCDSGTPLSELRYEDAVRYKVNCRNNLPSGMSDCVVRRGAKKSGIKKPTWFRLECERDFSNIKETHCNGAIVFEGLDYDAQNASKAALSPTTTLSTVEGLDIGAQNASKTALSPTTTLSTVEGLDYNAWNVSNSTSPSTMLLPTNESIPAPKDTVLIIGACFAPIFLLLVLFFVIFYRVKKRRIRK
ncbi:hypothetical protein VCUG_02625, partial [Vavraia culicis subsp. floridensis]